MDITAFVDESGTVAKGTVKKQDFFIITLLFVKNEDVDHVKKVFRKERLKVVKKKPPMLEQLKNNHEIKGSELSEKEKEVIYERLIEKCSEKFEIAVILLNNEKATVKFRSNSSRTFNYLIKTFLSIHFKNKSKYKGLNSVNFIIDERNVATESRYTLQEYLNTELNLLDHFSDEDICVHYYDSKKYLLLQLADFISNTFYRYYQKNSKEAKGNVEMLLKQTSTNKVFRFPYFSRKTEYNSSRPQDKSTGCTQ